MNIESNVGWWLVTSNSYSLIPHLITTCTRVEINVIQSERFQTEWALIGNSGWVSILCQNIFLKAFNTPFLPLVYLHSDDHKTCSLVVEKAAEFPQQNSKTHRDTLGNGKSAVVSLVTRLIIVELVQSYPKAFACKILSLSR